MKWYGHSRGSNLDYENMFVKAGNLLRDAGRSEVNGSHLNESAEQTASHPSRDG